MVEKYSHLHDPKLLEARIENHVPLVTIGDIVKVNDFTRESEHQGRTGDVVEVLNHALGRTARGDIELRVKDDSGYFPINLYSVDLMERIGEVAIYLDDRVVVAQKDHPLYNKSGRVMVIRGDNCVLGYKIQEDSVYDRLLKLEVAILDHAHPQIRRKLDSQRLFARFKQSLSESDPEFLAYLIESGTLRDHYEALETNRILNKIASNPVYAGIKRKIAEEDLLQVDNTSIKLIEQYPPNTLFKTV
jgi:hypothetical protein